MIVPFRQQAVTFWEKQSKPQRITLVVLLLAACIIVPLLVNWSTTPSYAVVFSDLSESDAGQIVEKLKENSIPYQLKNASTVMVPSSQVYEVRLMMARQGIPQNSTVGFEVFSGSSLGMNDFFQKVNYNRALEGELERTIASIASIETARVHIVTPDETIYSSQKQDGTASVTLKIRGGQRLDTTQVNAITHLVANSVKNLKSDHVVVVDTNGKMLTQAVQDQAQLGSLTQADSHRQIEQQAAQNIQQKVQAMLDSALGPNKSSVQADVVMDWVQRETTSQTFNPTPAAVRSSHVVDEKYTLGGANGGVPGAASNLPTPVATLTVAVNNTLYEKKEETFNYELTQTQLKEVGAPGEIKRISVSVMVDGISDPAILTGLKNAVTAAAGIDAKRGDSVAIESMAFDRTYQSEQKTEETAASQSDLYLRLGGIAAMGVAVFVLLVILLQMFSKLRKSAAEQWRPVMRPVSEMAMAAGTPRMPMPMMNAPAAHSMPEISGGEASSAMQVQNRIQELAKSSGLSPEDLELQKIVGQMTDDNPATVAEVIQMWLNEG